MSRPILGHKRSAWFVIIGIVTYTIFVGADAAVVRAAIMAAIFVVAARLMGRPTFAPAGLFTAALVMTLINPNILWDVTSDGRIILGCSDLTDIEVLDPDRGRLFTFSFEYTPVKITDADKDNHFAIFTMTVIRGNKKETKQGAPDYIKDNTGFPRYKPAFKDIVTDDEGNIWVRPFHEDRELEDFLFDVFDKKGLFIKRIRVFGETTFPSFLAPARIPFH